MYVTPRSIETMGFGAGHKLVASLLCRSFDRLRHVTALLCTSGLLLALSACGGGDAPVAVDDTLTIPVGQSGDLLANDSVDGFAATVGTSGNVRFAVTSGALPAGIGVDGGRVQVSASAAPGSVRFTYRICEAERPDSCGSASAQIVIPTPPIVATPDTLTLAPGASADALANDTLGGAPATAATVVASAATLPAGVQLSAAGVVSVTAASTPGVYTFAYLICQVSAPSNCATSTLTLTVPAPAVGALGGRAVNAATGAGVAGVLVSVAGQSTTTDAGGNFSFSGVPAGDRTAVAFTAAGYAPNLRIAAVAGAGRVDVQARLLPVGATLEVDAAAGGTFSVPGSTAQLVLPPNGLQRADGSAPTGATTLTITPIDPAADATVMPGDFTTFASGAEVLVESFGAVNVQMRDASGAVIDLRPGQTASLRIPLATRSASAPNSVPLFRLDDTTGRWVQDGTATRTGTGTTGFYAAPIARLGTWNADEVYNTVRVTGCVADANGVRQAGALVAADGIDYSGTSGSRTDANGQFTLAIRRAGQAAVLGVVGGRVTNTVRLGPFDADATVSNCLSLGNAGAGISMKLTWGASPSDLDAYLYAPNGSVISFENKGSLANTPYANLDVDDTTQYGPEVTTVTRLMVGSYQYAVNNYSGQSRGNIGRSGARVELNIPNRAAELFAPPTTGESSFTDWWLLFSLDVAADCTITVRRQGSFAVDAPVRAPSAVPVYCTPP